MGRAQRSMPSSAPSGGWSSSSLWGHSAAAAHALPCHCHQGLPAAPLVCTGMSVLLPPAVPSMALLNPFSIPFQPRFPRLCCLCVPHGRHPGGLQRALRPPGEPPPPVGCLRGQGALPTARRGERLPGAPGPLRSSEMVVGPSPIFSPPGEVSWWFAKVWQRGGKDGFQTGRQRGTQTSSEGRWRGKEGWALGWLG